MADPSIRQALESAILQSQGGLAPMGIRHSGQGAKGLGYFGKIPTPDGSFATELSSEFEHDGKTIEHPLLVPTLDAAEINTLVSGGEPTQQIYDKAQRHAIVRILRGESPFAGPSDFRIPVPK